MCSSCHTKIAILIIFLLLKPDYSYDQMSEAYGIVYDDLYEQDGQLENDAGNSMRRSDLRTSDVLSTEDVRQHLLSC